jgi:tetratricopeptide (TPR) repeat protein
MGLVYRAFDRVLGREVAIKTLTEGFVGDAEMLERFYREAAKTGMLKHANIVTVYDLGQQGGYPYIVMEYVAGDGLDRIIQSNRKIPLASKLRIVEQVCTALAYAHRNDVVHRDVKPANVIVQPDGLVKLLDFGIARQEKHDRGLTRMGSVIGTVHYMAPERLRNQAFDGRSDIFSTGVLLYQLVTGQLPFVGEDHAIIQKILNEKYPPLSNYLHSYPAELDAILDRALAKAPEDRYSHADEMAAEIATLAGELMKEQVAEMFQQAETLARNEEYTKAREVLLRIAKLDGQHVGARQLMVQVQQNLSLRQRAAQIQQFRSLAEDAVQEKRFDEAIANLMQALKLDPSSSELSGAIEALREKKWRYERIEGYLREADGARQEGDLETAQAVIAKAIELDKNDSRVRAAYAALVRQVEEAAGVARARKLLESARAEVGARHFTAAIKLLSEAERIDPSNPELISLLNTAKSGQEQEQRRRVVEQLQNEIAIAMTPEEVSCAAGLVNAALAKMPNEPTLLKLKAQLDRQTKDFDTRRTVDQTVQRCRALLETAPEEALQIVQERLRQFPGSERLQVLQANLEEHLNRATSEKARVRYLTLANDALNKRQYREAVRLLETCQAEGSFSDEMTGLLEFARHEAKREERESAIDQNLTEAQALMAKGAYDAVIRLLEPVVRQTENLVLRSLLEKASSQQQVLRRKADAISEAIVGFVREEQFDAGIAYLESQPRELLQQPGMQETLKSLRALKGRDRRVSQAIGTAYAALNNLDVLTGWNALQASLQAQPDSPFLQRVVQAFEMRRKAIADQALNSANERARNALAAGDAQGAQEALRAVTTLEEFASLEQQKEWRQLGKDATTPNILSRIGRKGPRSLTG